MKARVTAILALFAATACGPLRTGAHSDSSYFPMSADRLWEYHLRLQNGDVWPVVVHSRGPRFVPELGRVAAIFDEDYPDQRVPVAFFLSEGFLQSEIGLRYRLRRGGGVVAIGLPPRPGMCVSPRGGLGLGGFAHAVGA